MPVSGAVFSATRNLADNPTATAAPDSRLELLLTEHWSHAAVPESEKRGRQRALHGMQAESITPEGVISHKISVSVLTDTDTGTDTAYPKR